MRIEKVSIELCVSDVVKRGEVLLRICEALPRTVHGVLVAMPAARADREAEMDAACSVHPPVVLKQKRRYARRAKKTEKDGSEVTDGTVRRTVSRNANGETVTSRDLADGSGRVEIRR